MKNARPNQLKKCIHVPGTEFADIIHSILGNHVHVEFPMDGLDVYTDSACIEIDVLSTLLAMHFGVEKVVSIHTDHYDNVGVWIVYEDGERNG